MDVAIIIPCYNEEENISTLIRLIKKKIKAYIIIVDDSPNDFTKKLIYKKKNIY
jgi:glycosyltransferase involved in cell wall biosynthesis